MVFHCFPLSFYQTVLLSVFKMTVFQCTLVGTEASLSQSLKALQGKFIPDLYHKDFNVGKTKIYLAVKYKLTVFFNSRKLLRN